jgi:cation diffusion facilitator CzcD-associated flavoprotein CzcO
MLQTTPKPAAPGDKRPSPQIAILGAGFSGMGMAIALKEHGVDNFTIYEKADDVGGTWRENTYPGVACDVPSHLYSFSFEPNAGWTRRYSPGGEIWDYMRACATKHGLYERTQFAKKVSGIRHDGARWTIDFADGTKAAADIVVSGLGGLHEPNIPDFPGKASFKGPIFHTAQWRHDVDLAGKRVAVVGSAASAVQVVPEIAPQVSHLDVYQRTANWVFPRQSYGYPAWLRRVFRFAPFTRSLYRAFYFNLLETRHFVMRDDDNFMKRRIYKLVERHLESLIADPELRRKITPTYPIGCKRILVSDDYLPAIQRPNVDLVVEGIERFEEGGIRTKDGKLHEADAIVLATGFRPFNLLESIEVKGPGGRTLRDTWSDGVTAHRTVAVPGFPNFFMLLGPNSGLGHNSVILMIEAQVKYVMQLIEAMGVRGAAMIEPSAEAAAAYDAHLQRALSHRVWAAGCGAWYVDSKGRNFTLYPHNVRTFLKEMKAPDFSEYAFEAAPAAA